MAYVHRISIQRSLQAFRVVKRAKKSVAQATSGKKHLAISFPAIHKKATVNLQYWAPVLRNWSYKQTFEIPVGVKLTLQNMLWMNENLERKRTKHNLSSKLTISYLETKCQFNWLCIVSSVCTALQEGTIVCWQVCRTIKQFCLKNLPCLLNTRSSLC